MLGAALAAALLAALVFAAAATSETPAGCKGGAHKELEVGIVTAVGCFTEATKDGARIYTGRWEDQASGIDLNGFMLTGPKGGALQINASNREVKSVALQGGPDSGAVQLNSVNWPAEGRINKLGDPIKLGFVAPEKGELLLDDLHFGSNVVAGALAGLSPVGTVETPIKIEEEGKGSMDLTIALAGVFALKGHPQSVTIALPTESRKGTKLDGFELSLEEIDTFKVVKVHEFEARYSAAKKEIAGSANLVFPFSKAGEKGFGGGFTLEDGVLNEIHASVSGLRIPIGAPPGGFVTGIGGGFKLKQRSLQDFDLSIKANMNAELGPRIPTPWGAVAPIEVAAALGAGHKGEEWFFEIRGGVKVFRLNTGDVYLAIHSNAGIEFGVGLGIGFPSYRNNEDDPFYIGARVEGWISKGHFQFEGRGRVALISLKLFDGRIMVNDRAAGACWTVLGVDGGAVYPYGTEVKTFGIGCGLDYYKERFPAGARISAAGARQFDLSAAEKTVTVRGAGAAPRFTMRSRAGRAIRIPAARDAAIVRKGFRHAYFVNRETNTTHVILPRPAGEWTIRPSRGSAAIVSVKAGREAPRERVSAEVRGRGPVRTLSWDSMNRDNTELLFLERLPSGRELPILRTDKPRGSHRFRVHTGGHYGKRSIRVVVIHGYGSRQDAVVDRFRVAKPRRLPGPSRIRAWRDGHDVNVHWARVRGARGYLVEVSLPGKGKRLTNMVRKVGPQRRSVRIPSHPGDGVATARVQALNRDDRSGRPARTRFLTGPPPSSLREAARDSAATASARGGSVRLRTICPVGPHCRVVAQLRVGGRVLARQRFQQTPDTFGTVWLRPPARARAALRADSARVWVRIARGGRRPAVQAPLAP